MRIVQINVAAGITSTGRIVDQIAEVGTALGHECWIAHSLGTARVPERAITIGSRSDTLVHALHTRITDRHGLASARATNRLTRQIEQLSPDLIHLHNIHGYYINYEVLMRWLAQTGLPVVWTMHDCWAFTGHCAYPHDCQQWQEQCQPTKGCPRRGEYPASWLIDNAQDNFQRKRQAFTALRRMAIVTPSQWLASQVQQSFFKNRPVVTLNNGINKSAFSPIANARSDFDRQYHTQGRTLLLGVANRWEPRRGLDDFVELARRLPSDRFAVALVGLSKRIPGIINIPYITNQHTLAKTLSAADWYLNLTYADTYPTTNLEARACGIPVVTYASGGAPETVQSFGGVAVSPGDLEAIIRLVSQPAGDSMATDGAPVQDYHTAFAKYYQLYPTI